MYMYILYLYLCICTVYILYLCIYILHPHGPYPPVWGLQFGPCSIAGSCAPASIRESSRRGVLQQHGQCQHKIAINWHKLPEHNHNYPPLVINRTVATLGSDFDDNKKNPPVLSKSSNTAGKSPKILLFRWKHSIRNVDVPSARFDYQRGWWGRYSNHTIISPVFSHYSYYRLYYRITSTTEATY